MNKVLSTCTPARTLFGPSALTVEAEVNDCERRRHTEEVEGGGADGEQDHRAAGVVDREEGKEQKEKPSAPLEEDLRRS